MANSFTGSDGDYREYENHTLIALNHFHLLSPLRCAAKILLSVERDTETIWNKSGLIAQYPTAENTYPLWEISKNVRVIDCIIEWKFKRMAIDQVLEARLDMFPVSRDLLDFEDKRLGDDWINPIFRQMLESGRRLRVSYENWQDEHDIKLFAADAAVMAHDELSGGVSVIQPKMRLPALPAELNLPINDPPPFDRIFPAWFYWRVTESIKRHLPALDGTLENRGIQAGRRAIETKGRAARRQNSKLVGTSVENIEMRDNRGDDASGETIRATIPRAGDKNPDGKRVKPYRAAGIDPIMNTPFLPAEDVIIKEQNRQKVNAVVAEFGEQVREYLKQRADLKQKEAAAAVGVSESTARRWEVAFRKKYKEDI